MIIAGILFAIFAAGALFILFAPFVFTSQFSAMKGDRHGIFSIRWIHPWVASATYTMGSDTLEFRLFGWNGKKADRESNGVKSAPSSQQEWTERPSVAPAVMAEVRKAASTVTSAPAESIDKSYPLPETLSIVTPKPSPSSFEPVEKKTASDAIPSSPRPSPSDASSRPPQPQPEPISRKSASPSKPRRFTWARITMTLAILRNHHVTSKLFRWTMRLIRFTFRIIRFDHLRLHVAAGVTDPAETGKYFGYLSALRSSLVSDNRKVAISFEPRFMVNTFEFEGSIALRTSIAAMVMPFVVALLTFPYLTVFFVWRRLKKVYTVSETISKAG